MMENDKLRKADIFSGTVIMFFGLWIVSQAMKMPMKGSWGGVQNVWYVSPALFPLFVGAMIALLGALLLRKAVKTVGPKGLKEALRWLAGRHLVRYLMTPPVFRFYAIVVLFFSFVFLIIPRVDFFLGAILFLIVFITIFYFDDDFLLKKLLRFYLAGTVTLIAVVSLGLFASLEGFMPYPADMSILVFIIVYCIYAGTLTRNAPPLRKKFRTALILAIAAPFTIGPIFKYLLLVPMPTEGMVVALLDAIWYWDF